VNKYFISFSCTDENGSGFGNGFFETSELLTNNEAVQRIEKYIAAKLILRDVFDAQVTVLNFQLIKEEQR